LAVVSAAGAQTPRVGDINFYGLRKVAAERILSALELKSGDPLPALRTVPAGSATLPSELSGTYREFLSAVAGEADAELHQFWEKGERETVIRQALGQSGGSRRKHGG
jgi:hypothetical protein